MHRLGAKTEPARITKLLTTVFGQATRAMSVPPTPPF